MAARMIEDVDGVMVAAPELAADRDCYVVRTAELSPVVKSFIADWKRTRPSDGGKTQARVARSSQSRRRRSTMFSPYDWLAQETGLTRDTIRDISRGPRRRVYTPLSEADAIATALGRPGLLTGSGAMRVMPHPRGCGRASLTGVASSR